eukprot:g7437.t1
MMTSKLSLQSLRHKHEWLAALGYKLVKQPEGFSPAALLSHLLQDAAFSGEAWRTALLTGNVREQACAGAAKVNLVALPSPEDSRAFWTDRLKVLLGLPNFPTGPQAEEVKATVGLLVCRASGKGLSTLMEACLSVEKPNATVGPIILAAVIDMAPRKVAPVSADATATAAAAAAAAAAAPTPRTWASVTAAGLPPNGSQFPMRKPVEDCGRTMVTEEESSTVELLNHESMASLLANCGVTSIRTLVMIMGGVAVDALKADVKTLPKLKGVNIPRSVRRAIVKALAKSSWFALLGVFRFRSFFKNLFKSIHIAEVLKDREGNTKTEPNKAKVFLLQALLRGNRYPPTQAAFAALAKAGQPWDKLIAAPLARIAEDPLFRVDGEWTLPQFQPRLAGVRIPMPRATSVECMLCAHGNRRATWHAIFDCGEITSRQILRNVVSLAMMDFPVEIVRAQLLKSIDCAPMGDLLKTYTVLKTTFTPAEVSALRDEALDKGFEAFNNVEQEASLSASSSSQPTPSRAARRRRKAKPTPNPSLSVHLGQPQSAAGATATPFVHPEPPPRKKVRTPTGSVVSAAVAAAAGVAAGGDVAGSGSAEAEEKERIDGPAGEVRVEREYGVADKKGQRHQILRPRTVSTSFGQASVDAYLALVTSALSQKMDDVANGAPAKDPDGVDVTEEAVMSAKAPVEDATMIDEGAGDNRRAAGKEEVVGVISYTEELSKNVVRTGIPPPLPKYTRVAMWRGEEICLNQLGAGDMKELMVGIQWCQPKQSRQKIDLDLSVMVYDSKWSHLADCSYDTPDMRIPGVQHSGDVLSAPYPDGARETCRVNFAELQEHYPTARYIVLAVYSFSRQKWDELEDASVFVANPHARGSGPRGMAVISAARLTGAATTSIAGYLDLAPNDAGKPEQPPEIFGIRRSPQAVAKNKKDTASSSSEGTWRIHFVFTDQEGRISRGGYHARGSTDAVGQILAKMEESRRTAGAQTLADAAAFQAALVCDRVHIVAGEGPHKAVAVKPASMLVCEYGEGRFAFYERIAGALDNHKPAAPAAGKHSGGGAIYPAEIIAPARLTIGGNGNGRAEEPGAIAAARHTLFFGGDLDDWLEVTRHHGARTKAAKVEKGGPPDEGCSTLTLVNLRSAEKGWSKADEAGVLKVNGATAYEELALAVRAARAVGGSD